MPLRQPAGFLRIGPYKTFTPLLNAVSRSRNVYFEMKSFELKVISKLLNVYHELAFVKLIGFANCSKSFPAKLSVIISLKCNPPKKISN